ncbi:Chromate resistance exported protein (plasmid) [Caballeronia sp. SBC1]|uniref:chromate resistance protein ChrB domain-containing protein n=1 Tax=Caballeronia sp. SBC2 TaxID=2705547 RepID=UPI0013E13E58|nr:chromate resistance protein ChrB domain-containing protein [Caballeronia sp. SBC2]QIE26620.1 Chromate resistance exported protein [Caballeronia sp. SBC2]QIN64064.1 Chromate resistance exported protein [Caballeronia sp. SBC1]
MKWVTKNFVHLDRVACPWLIKRFVDNEAQFSFVPWDKQDEVPSDAIPFALDGADLGPHDAEGTTFAKVLKKYSLKDPALDDIARIIAAGVNYALDLYQPSSDDNHGQVAVGLLAISEGIMLNCTSDAMILESSYPVYDALYAYFRAKALMKAKGLTPPPPAGRGPGPKTEFLRELLKNNGR